MTVILVGLATSHAAFACDLKALPFGKDIAEVTEQYGLDEATGTDRVEVTLRASKFCEKLPADAVMHFTFVRGVLAGVAIENGHGKNELYALVHGTYGDGKRRPRESDASKSFHITWVKDNAPVVLYTSRTKKEGGEKEYLTINTREAADALGEISAKAEAEGK